MAKTIALTRTYTAAQADKLRSGIVAGCAIALILAGTALPF